MSHTGQAPSTKAPDSPSGLSVGIAIETEINPIPMPRDGRWVPTNN